MNKMKMSSLIWLMAGAVAFTACNGDDEETPASLTVSSIKTLDGTDLYGATSAVNVGTDQSIVITFSAAVNPSSLGGVALKNGSNTVDAALVAAGSIVTIDPTSELFGGTIYTVEISGVQSVDGGTSGNVSTTFTTAGIGLGTAPQSDAQTTYFQFNGNYADVLGLATLVNSQNSWVDDRFGATSSALYLNGAMSPGTGDIVEFNGDFIHESMTISTWFKVNPADYTGSRAMFGLAVERGYFMEVGGDIAWLKLATSHQVSPDPANHYFATAWTDPNGDGQTNESVLVDYLGSIASLVTSDWAHLVMTFDAATSVKTIYVNGTIAMQVDLNVDPLSEWNLGAMGIGNQADGTGDPVEGISENLAFGFLCAPSNTATGWANYAGAENTFKGAIDDFRIWDVSLSTEQVTALYNAEKP